MKILFIGGWGIDPASYDAKLSEVFRGAEIECVVPCESVGALIKESDADCLIGYSLGAFLLMKYREYWGGRRIVLLAPFTNFLKESCVKSAQLNYLKKWVKRDVASAVQDFYDRAGIGFSIQGKEVPYAERDLIWGLDCLLGDEVVGWDGSAEVSGVIGSGDKLLDVGRVDQYLKGVDLVEGVGHCFFDLIESVKLSRYGFL